MKILRLKNLSKKDYQKLIKRSALENQNVAPVVKKILNDVLKNGDKAVLKYNQKFGGSKIPYPLKVGKEEIRRAYKDVDKNFIKALKQAEKNITAVCKSQINKISKPIETEKGIFVWSEFRAIEKVGLYIPGGKVVYPSSVLMSGIPAIIAECKEIILCSPPNEKGEIPSATLVAADMIGIKKIFKVGGAQAIAAMAYGTKTIPKVYKIFGAGNSYVTEAKMQVYGSVDIDMPAGPSEVFIIADKTANPAFIAADLLADGEHGSDSACVLVTTSVYIAEETIKEIKKQLATLSTKKRVKESLKKYGLIALADSLDEAIAFSNEHAPEHLEIMTKNREKLVKKINNAGSVFLGSWTTKSAGDYATGANHVLPTGGFAKMFSPLSVASFGKMIQVQIVESKIALKKIKKTIETFGKIEQLPAHKNSVSIRFKDYETN